MLDSLFSSKTRIKVLLKLFLNPEISCYLRELSKEFDTSPNSLKEELDRLSDAGYLEREQNGRSVFFRANQKHPFFPEINSIVRKTFGIDKLLDELVQSIGNLEEAYILDDYAQGRDTGVIDLLLVGDIDRARVEDLRQISERKINRIIRVACIGADELESKGKIFLQRPHWKVI